jgi:putative membrane protein
MYPVDRGPVSGPGSPPPERAMAQERILKEASFAPKVVRYFGTSTAVAMVCFVFLIPAIPIVIPLVILYQRKQYARLRVYLTTRDLKVHRGVLTREEKAIPLEKITDLAVFQGPVMRHFGLKGIRVETAGQSAGPGALVSIIGVEDTDGFRDLVLRQRDRITDSDDEPAEVGDSGNGKGRGSIGSADPALLAALRDIHDTLQRIEEALRREDPR